MQLAKRLHGVSESIFAVIGKKANKKGIINLSQGFPDFDGPDFLKKFAISAIQNGHNQYSPAQGLPALRESLVDLYQRKYGLNYALEECLITTGATEAIYLAIHALVNPTDEVILFEPFYDSYLTCAKMCGATIHSITLSSEDDFALDFDSFEKKLTSKTKLVAFNNPHNPSGKVFSASDVERLVKLCIKNKTYLLSDEVYEYLRFDGLTHTPSALFDEAREWVISTYSSGKTFGMTGWKLGWSFGPKPVIEAMRLVHESVSFCCNTPMQFALAEAISSTELDDYLEDFIRTYEAKRDYFCGGLRELGFEFFNPQGTYFMLLSTSYYKGSDDFSVVQNLLEGGLASIPPSPFYLSSHEGKKMIRLCFAKTEETLATSLKALKLLKL